MTAALAPFDFQGQQVRVLTDEHGEPAQPDEMYLYVAAIVDNGCKVGITKDPQTRIKTHCREAAAFGRRVSDVWLSAPHKNARANESLLVKRVWGSTRRTEYLPLRFADLVIQAQELPKERSAPGEFDDKCVATTELLKRALLGPLPGRPIALDTLKYVVLLSDLLLGAAEDAETFLDDLEALVKPFGPISEKSVYSDGSPMVTRTVTGGARYNLPPGFKTGGAS